MTATGRPDRSCPELSRAAPPVRVAHLIGVLDRGGAEISSLDICRSVPVREVTQTFVTLAGREGTLAAEFRQAGAEVVQCPLRPLSTFAFRWWRLLRRMRPHAVVSHISLASAVGLAVARAAGVRIRIARLWSEGDGRTETLGRRAGRATLRRLLAWSATQVVGVTGAALAFARPPVGDPRYRVLPNAIDVSRIRGWERGAARRHLGVPEGAVLLAHVGRAASEKNRPFLVDIHAAARAREPEVVLLAAGPGGVADLTARHPGIHADPWILLPGELPEVAPVLAAADVLVLPSRREGLPGIVLEALAAGLPVVAADLPCLREVARQVPGVTLLDLGRGPETWAATVLAAARTDASTRDRIRNGLTESPFLVEKVADLWRAVWHVTPR